MPTTVTTITGIGLLNFFVVIALTVPVIILAILVDSSNRIGKADQRLSEQERDRAVVRQSRRTLLAIGIGAFTELDCLVAILTTSDHQTLDVYDHITIYAKFVEFTFLLYILFVPHIELHITSIRHDSTTARWSITVGWIVDLCILIVAFALRFIAGSTVSHVAAYAWFAVFLILTGAMITLTIFAARKTNSHPSHEPDGQDSK